MLERLRTTTIYCYWNNIRLLTPLYSSLSSGFPGATVSGCKFHHDQALYKTGILKNGLATLYTSHLEFRKWIELLICLPLLPSDRIIEMFKYLKMNKPVIPESENEKMKKLLKYYQRYWLEQIGSSRRRHAQTCTNCTETIASSEGLNNCLVCRGPIESFFQIFL